MTSTPRSIVERNLPCLCFDPVWTLIPAAPVADEIEAVIRRLLPNHATRPADRAGAAGPLQGAHGGSHHVREMPEADHPPLIKARRWKAGMPSTAIGGKVGDGVLVPFEAKAGPLRRHRSFGRFMWLGENGAS